jgi:RNA polymerase sigma-70 factor (ECF subfamily)
MGESPTTRLTLLARLQDVRDGAAWAEFVEIYAPLVYGLARRHSLQDADAADVAQDVLRAVVRALPRFTFDPLQGSFRGWLFTVARNQLRKFIHTRSRQPQGTGDSGAQALLEAHPAHEEDIVRWDQEYQARLFAWAAEKARPNFREATWQAFWRTAVEGQDARQVGQTLGLSAGAVYIAKSRVLARIKVLVDEVQRT